MRRPVQPRHKTVKSPPSFDPTAPGYGTPGASWYLDRAQVTLRKWRCRGEGPAHRLINGRAWYDRSALDAFIESHPLYTSTSERSAAEAIAAVAGRAA